MPCEHPRHRTVLFPVIIKNSGNTAHDFIDAVNGVKWIIKQNEVMQPLGVNGEDICILDRSYAQKIPGVIKTLFEAFNNVALNDANALDKSNKVKLSDAIEFLKDKSAIYLSNWEEVHRAVDRFTKSIQLP